MIWIYKTKGKITDVRFGGGFPGTGWEPGCSGDPAITRWTQSLWICVDGDVITEIYNSVYLPENYLTDGRNWKFVHKDDPQVAAHRAAQEQAIREQVLRNETETKIRNAMLDPTVTDFEAERMKILTEAGIA